MKTPALPVEKVIGFSLLMLLLLPYNSVFAAQRRLEAFY